jgi:hypothetical protein
LPLHSPSFCTSHAPITGAKILFNCTMSHRFFNVIFQRNRRNISLFFMCFCQFCKYVKIKTRFLYTIKDFCLWTEISPKATLNTTRKSFMEGIFYGKIRNGTGCRNHK